MKRIVSIVSTVLIASVLSLGCAGTAYVRTAPPAPKVETRPAKPGPKAVWIDGHWKWNGKRYVWQAGHWERKPKGAWVAGHWKKTPRGHVWVKGHWKH
jgi:hypothetical protein